ncbi:MAG: type 1 glutamine amidotransferase [Actinomycetales bacterium]
MLPNDSHPHDTGTNGAVRLLVVEHQPTCTAGTLGDEFSHAGASVTTVRPGDGDEVPSSLVGVDGLVVLGGAMGANDDDRAPWLPATRALLAAAVDQGVPALGVCLGHQLLAVASGGSVARNAAGPQAGVLPLSLTEEGRRDPVLGVLYDGSRVVHWNFDTVLELPPHATVLARCGSSVQAMRVGERAWGLQFHPEVTGEIVAEWAREDEQSGALPDALGRLPEVESAEPEIRRGAQRLAAAFLDVAAA